MGRLKMKAALLKEPNGKFQIEEVELEEPREGEVMVRLAASGVCHSDWHVATGDTKQNMPCLAGHEGAGVVTKVGPGSARVKVGDRVTLSWTPECGSCFYCLRHQPHLCETYTAPLWEGVTVDGTSRVFWNDKPVYVYCGLGTFAEYCVVPEPACVVVPPDTPLTTAALVGCGVATGVGAALYTAKVQPGDNVAVFGAGGIGLNIIQGAAMCGAKMIVAIDKNEEKMELARQFGATHTFIAGTRDDPTGVDAVKGLTEGRGAEHVFEAIGVASVQEVALGAVRPGGQLTLVGLSPVGSATNFPGAVLTRTEKTVKGSYYGSVDPKRDFPLFLEMEKAGKLKLKELITQEHQLEQINEAYSAMLGGKVARGVIIYPFTGEPG